MHYLQSKFRDLFPPSPSWNLILYSHFMKRNITFSTALFMFLILYHLISSYLQILLGQVIPYLPKSVKQN